MDILMIKYIKNSLKKYHDSKFGEITQKDIRDRTLAYTVSAFSTKKLRKWTGDWRLHILFMGNVYMYKVVDLSFSALFKLL